MVSSGWMRLNSGQSLMTSLWATPAVLRGTWKASIQASVYLVKEWLMLIVTPESFSLMAIFISTGDLLRHRHQLVGRWTKGYSAGGSRNSSSYGSNPKFWLKVCDSGEVVLSLFQHRKWSNMEKRLQSPIKDRTPKHQRYQAIALHMWEVWIFVCHLRNSGLFVLFMEHFFAYRWRKSALISASCWTSHLVLLPTAMSTKGRWSFDGSSSLVTI